MSDELSLKWGTWKSMKLNSDAARLAYDKYKVLPDGEIEIGKFRTGETLEQREALCELIDAVDCEKIYLSWDGKYVSKEDAKRYVMGY
jgi:hypothetical protein